MGKENNQLTGTEAAEGTGQGKGQGKGNPSTPTESTRDRKRRGQGQGQGQGQPAATEEKSSLISLVETPEVDEKEAERRKRRAELQRERRKQKKEQKEGTPSPKAKAKADPTQIKILLSTVSMILASKEGMEVWILSDSEIDQIAKPLANILSKYEGVSKLSGEYADHIALLMACFAIFFPRIMATLQNKKSKKEVKVHARRDQHSTTGTGENRESLGTTETSRGSNDRKPSVTTANVNPILSGLLPATSGF